MISHPIRNLDVLPVLDLVRQFLLQLPVQAGAEGDHALQGQGGTQVAGGDCQVAQVGVRGIAQLLEGLKEFQQSLETILYCVFMVGGPTR